VSTILKALQRLEDEKSAQGDRSLNEQIVARRSRAAANGRWLMIGIALIGGVAVGSSALYFWPTGGAPALDATPEAVPPAMPPTASQPDTKALTPESPSKPLESARAARAQKREPAANRAATPVSPVVEVVKRLDAEPAADPVPAEQSGAKTASPGTNRPGDRRRVAKQSAKKQSGSTPTERTNPRPAAVASKRVPEPKVAAAPVVVAAVDPTEDATRTATAPVEDVAVIADPPLGAAEPSQPISAPTTSPTSLTRDQKVVHRAEIPLLIVDQTIWHPDGDRRLAVVELVNSGEALRLREGDAVGPLVIWEIKPGGVLFNHDGVEVEYRVGQ
jgi:hypothetical protein